MGTLPSWMLEVISPRPDDSSDLRWAVETVAAMWARGDGRKTLLWLKQAAETARGDGMDDRAGALAQAAVEFERLGLGETTASGEISSVGGRPAVSSGVPKPPPAAPGAPPPPAAGAPPPPPPHAPRPRAPSSANLRRKVPPTAPYRQADAPTHMEAPASDLIEAIRRVDDTDPDHPPMESKPEASRPLPPISTREPLEATVVMQAEARDLALASRPDNPAPASPRVSDNPPTMESPRAPLQPMHAVRVAVRLGGTGNELSAVLLDDGEAAPEGTQEAILLAISGSPKR